jgi:signal transduction histidine kinase
MGLGAAHHALTPPILDDTFMHRRTITVEALEGAGRYVPEELGAVGGERCTEAVEDFNRQTAGIAGPKVEQPVNIDDEIREVLRIARSEVERHGTEIHLDLAVSDVKLLGDATQLKQVVLNLIQNGMEAMDDLTQPSGKIEITSRRSKTEIEVTIRDFGSGISPEIASQIFEPMYSTKASGMGMGLAICKSIIEAHEGVLTAAGENDGTRFIFSLPVHPQPAS